MTAQLCFQKPKRLIEEVDKDPLYVIKKVFAEIDRDFPSGDFAEMALPCFDNISASI
jgi:hypothetical protein